MTDTPNPIDRLSLQDVETVRQCLTAAVRGPFFPEWEFSTLIGGLERRAVDEVLARWPDRTNPETQAVAVNDVLNNLLSYPHNEWGAWSRCVSVTPEAVAGVLARWRGDDDFDASSRGYFERLS